MGEFRDAFYKGEKDRQNRMEEERRKNAAELQQINDAVAAANGWVDNVLKPVVIALHNDLAGIGDVEIVDASRSSNVGGPFHIVWDITIALNGHKATKLRFQIDQDGAISVYRDKSDADVIGSIAMVDDVQVTQFFRETIHSIGAED